MHILLLSGSFLSHPQTLKHIIWKGLLDWWTRRSQLLPEPLNTEHSAHHKAEQVSLLEAAQWPMNSSWEKQFQVRSWSTIKIKHWAQVQQKWFSAGTNSWEAKQWKLLMFRGSLPVSKARQTPTLPTAAATMATKPWQLQQLACLKCWLAAVWKELLNRDHNFN